MTGSRGRTVELIELTLMLGGLAVQVVGLCWLPSNLRPENGLDLSDFYAFGLVLGGAALVGCGLVMRMCVRALRMRAGETTG